ncbi:hypothetical protein [Candidatus Berkiella aquae]|uniref:Uncharacterized protein n=1 Tax=Candidatus Berkiella aquae TaxID=295108 RepID=A0A0Q9YQ25_9GAMM|nr:hypothetical protein [Candidatus Berkiella aquae]MCS5710839.1 hypothetical protein [Candidatus Berkiella aquae]
MKWQFIRTAEAIDHKLQYVDMNDGIVYLENSNGFKTYGVSACIVFVAYQRDQLLFMWHWEPPGSKRCLEKVDIEVKELLQEISDSLDSRGISQKETTIYAVGGQESSYNSICVLQMLSKIGNKLFNLNTEYLCKVHYEDFFDLYVLANKPLFHAIHYHVAVTAKEMKKQDKCIPSTLNQLALYCHHLFKIEIEESFNKQLLCSDGSLDRTSKEEPKVIWHRKLEAIEKPKQNRPTQDRTPITKASQNTHPLLLSRTAIKVSIEEPLNKIAIGRSIR